MCYDRRHDLAHYPAMFAARQMIADLTHNPRPNQAKELDGHAGFYRLWLPRDHRLVWSVLEDEQIVDLLDVGPKAPDL